MRNAETSSTLTSEITFVGSNLPKRQRIEIFEMATSPNAPFSQSSNVSRQLMLDIRMRAQENRNFQDDHCNDPLLLLGRLDTMRQLECTQYAFTDVISENEARRKYIFSPAEKRGERLVLFDAEDRRCDDKHEKIVAYCREKMCLWCFRIIDHFDLPREFVSISMSYVDRFQSAYDCDTAVYKLTCMTALHIVSKIHGMSRAMTILPEGLAILSRGEFTAQDIFDMEFILLNALQWQYLNPPTANANARMMIFLFRPKVSASVKQKMMDVTCFLTEIAICDRFLTVCNPSDVAVASVLVAIDTLSEEELAFDERLHMRFAIDQVFQVNTSSVTIQEIQERLIELYNLTEEFYVQHKSREPSSSKNRNFRTKKCGVIRAHDDSPSS